MCGTRKGFSQTPSERESLRARARIKSSTFPVRPARRLSNENNIDDFILARALSDGDLLPGELRPEVRSTRSPEIRSAVWRTARKDHTGFPGRIPAGPTHHGRRPSRQSRDPPSGPASNPHRLNEVQGRLALTDPRTSFCDLSKDSRRCKSPVHIRGKLSGELHAGVNARRAGVARGGSTIQSPTGVAGGLAALSHTGVAGVY
jgi:hypothetical protein